jgi:hypothetical protein
MNGKGKIIIIDTSKNYEKDVDIFDTVHIFTELNIITKYLARNVSVHDSQATELLLDERDWNQPFYADSVYREEPQEKVIEKNIMENRVCEKGIQRSPLEG